MNRGGAPSAFTTSFTGCSNGRVENCRSARLAHAVAHAIHDGALPQVISSDAVARQEFFDVASVLRGNAGFQLLGGNAFLFAIHTGRHQQVHPVRFALHLLVDPGQLDLQGLGRVAHRPQHAKATGVGHLRHHVTAVGKRKQRKFHAQHLAQLEAHAHPPLRLDRPDITCFNR